MSKLVDVQQLRVELPGHGSEGCEHGQAQLKDQDFDGAPRDCAAEAGGQPLVHVAQALSAQRDHSRLQGVPVARKSEGVGLDPCLERVKGIARLRAQTAEQATAGGPEAESLRR